MTARDMESMMSCKNCLGLTFAPDTHSLSIGPLPNNDLMLSFIHGFHATLSEGQFAHLTIRQLMSAARGELHDALCHLYKLI